MIDFQFNYPTLGSEAALISEAIRRLLGESTAWIAGRPFAGSPEHRRAAASFLSQPGFQPSPSSLFLCSGGHCSLSVVFASSGLAGAALAVDELSYPSFRVMAEQRGIRLIHCAGDADGMLPDALAEAASAHGARGVYLMPTVHNPLGSVMPLSRRQELAAVIRRHDLTLIEDDAYRFLEPDPPAPISALAPERSYYIYSFLKPVAPGLKVAYFVVPEKRAGEVEDFVAQHNSGTSLLFAEALTALVRDGSVARLIAEKQALGRERQGLIAKSLEGFVVRGHCNAFHAWIELPPGINSRDFCCACKERGVLLSSGASYGNGRAGSERFIRLAVGNEPERDRVVEGLETVKRAAHDLRA